MKTEREMMLEKLILRLAKSLEFKHTREHPRREVNCKPCDLLKEILEEEALKNGA